MQNKLPNVYLDQIDIEECKGTEYHWCSHNQKDNFNIPYVPKARLDVAVAALKEINQHLTIPAAEYVPAIPEVWKIIEMALEEIGE